VRRTAPQVLCNGRHLGRQLYCSPCVCDAGDAHEPAVIDPRGRSLDRWTDRVLDGAVWLRSAVAGCLLACAAACVTSSEVGPFAFFEPLPPDDVFAPLIREWQAAEQVEAADARMARTRGAPGPVEGELASTYREFSTAVRRKIVDQVVAWVQMQSDDLAPAPEVAERGTALERLLERGEGRYDGFELLTFSLLRARGFGEGELFRSILRRGQDDVYHRVTLWFAEGEQGDPYVLDPTGWVTREVQPVSGIEPWQPVRIYDETRQYGVESR